MVNGPVHAVLQHLRNLEAIEAAASLSDGQLLRRFVADQDEAAFNVLLHRHGPLVWSVCHRVLGCRHNAEDVFQATFLTLARKAASIRKHASIAAWLYGVAYRLARQLRARDGRRPVPQAKSADDPTQDPVQRVSVQELQTIVDEELHRLRECYRLPLVLCFLEGKTRDEAAVCLGWSVSTLKRRLAKGREILCSRLTRRGLILSGALLSTALTQDLAAAAVPPTLVIPTLQAAVIAAAGRSVTSMVPAQVTALTEGVLRAMMMTKLKIATVGILTLVGLGAGVGVCARYAVVGAAQGDASKVVAKDAPPVQKKDEKDPAQEKLLKELAEAREAERQARLEAEVAKRRADQARLIAERARLVAEAARREAEQLAKRQADKAKLEIQLVLDKLASKSKHVEDLVIMLEQERKRADEAAALSRKEADFVMTGKFQVRLTAAGAVSMKAETLPGELVFTTAADDKDQVITKQQIRVCLFDKNGGRVAGGLVFPTAVKQPETNQLPWFVGKGKTTVIVPPLSLDPGVRPG
jgi:RNA polymerase sigma factor (sigma-70 family)